MGLGSRCKAQGGGPKPYKQRILWLPVRIRPTPRIRGRSAILQLLSLPKCGAHEMQQGGGSPTGQTRIRRIRQARFKAMTSGGSRGPIFGGCMHKKTLCMDLDGVLHSYTSGWGGHEVIADPPVPGAMEFLYDALK